MLFVPRVLAGCFNALKTDIVLIAGRCCADACALVGLSATATSTSGAAPAPISIVRSIPYPLGRPASDARTVLRGSSALKHHPATFAAMVARRSRRRQRRGRVTLVTKSESSCAPATGSSSRSQLTPNGGLMRNRLLLPVLLVT